ncbi:PAS domain-containing protein [Candidatus Nitrospira bockiana]
MSPTPSDIQARVLESVPIAHLAVDMEGALVLANAAARSSLGVRARDLRRAFRDLQLSSRPVDLRRPIEDAYRGRCPIRLQNVEWPHSGGPATEYEILIVPLTDPSDVLLGASITFQDTSSVRKLRIELQRVGQELDTVKEELQSANEGLLATNETLLSSVEGLEATNEELHSTNEELEIVNEDLQAANDALRTANTELRERTDELERVHRFEESILASLRIGVVVLDHRLNVLHWNHEAEDICGLRFDEVKGKAFLSLDIEVPDLAAPIRAVLNDEGRREVVVPVINRRGRSVMCRVKCSLLCQPDRLTDGVILFMEEN